MTPAPLPLFPAAPIQHPPSVIECGRHYLIVCGACLGTGRAEGDRRRRACPTCTGAGWNLRRLDDLTP